MGGGGLSYRNVAPWYVSPLSGSRWSHRRAQHNMCMRVHRVRMHKTELVPELSAPAAGWWLLGLFPYYITVVRFKAERRFICIARVAWVMLSRPHDSLLQFCNEFANKKCRLKRVLHRIWTMRRRHMCEFYLNTGVQLEFKCSFSQCLVYFF